MGWLLVINPRPSEVNPRLQCDHWGRRNEEMIQANSIRWATWLAASGAAIWIAFHLYYIFSGIVGASILIFSLGVLLMALAVYSLLRSPSLGTAGKIGAGILLVGMTLVFIGAVLTGLNIWKSAWLLAIGGEALTALGLVAFSLGALAGGMRAPWKWLPLILAPVYLASFSTTSASFPA
jgi:hypothetical protein